MPYNSTPAFAPFVDTAWLSERHGDHSLKIVDASWHLPASGRNAKAEFFDSHIPNALYFDIDEIATKSELPHMLPTEAEFEKFAGKLGLSNSDTIVVYDHSPLFSSARVWWMLHIFGAHDVRILQGGLRAWREMGGATNSERLDVKPAQFSACLMSGVVVSSAEVLEALHNGETQIIDARSSSRFRGIEKEARPRVRSGHIPTSINLPFDKLLSEGHLKPAAELAETFAACGYDPNKPAILTCGSGVTAAVLHLGLKTIGAKNLSLYDGSWAEWGAGEDLPIETGI